MELYRGRLMLRKEPSPVELAYKRALRALDGYEFGSEDYVKTMKVVQSLYEMKERERSSSISKDTLATVGANLLGILMIIKHERVNVITSKALSFVIRPRV
jgi:hypothetical protein